MTEGVDVVTPLESVVTFWDGPDEGRRVPLGGSSVQHGTAVFEGIRCYASAEGPALFRLREHMSRLLNSARLLGIAHDYGLDRLCALAVGAAAEAGLADCYVRPVLLAPDPYLSISLDRLRFTVVTEVWPVPPATGGRPAAIDLTVSPWRRPSPASFPPRAKAVGMYVTSALAKTGALRAGHDDAIQLDPGSGRVAEATVANVFLVRDGALVTPWLTDGLLAGITRDSVLTLARELGVPATEGPVEVADLLAADEVFLTGTASELVPVASVDGRAYPARRPVFAALSDAFRDAVTGKGFGHLGWLTPVPGTGGPE